MRRGTAVLAILMSLAAPVAAGLTIGPLPADAPEGFDLFFTKHVGVLGVHVYATASTSDADVLHAAGVLAQYLDNDEDGSADNPAVLAQLDGRHASMIMWPTFEAFESSGFEDAISDLTFDTTTMQPLFGAETNPGFPGNEVFDWALEECLHLVTFGGYARAYPSVFGESAGTQIAAAMDLNIANGFFHYDDPTCDYPCLISEYFYWALTSILGAQNHPWRIAEITVEWELYSEALVSQSDPAVHGLLTDPQWGLATVLPDGDYAPASSRLFSDGFESGDTSAWTQALAKTRR